MKQLYRLRVWSYDMGADVPQVTFTAFNDDDAKRQADILLKAYPAYMVCHLERESWETVLRRDAEPIGRGEAKELPSG